MCLAKAPQQALLRLRKAPLTPSPTPASGCLLGTPALSWLDVVRVAPSVPKDVLALNEATKAPQRVLDRFAVFDADVSHCGCFRIRIGEARQRGGHALAWEDLNHASHSAVQPGARTQLGRLPSSRNIARAYGSVKLERSWHARQGARRRASPVGQPTDRDAPRPVQ